MTSKSKLAWVLASSVALTAGCGDDDQLVAQLDSGFDPVTTPDASEAEDADVALDAGQIDAAGEVDAEADASEPDASEPDARVDVDAAPEVDARVEPDAAPSELSIIGRWHSNRGGTEVISADTFRGARIVEFDNDAMVMFTQNAADAATLPNAFNKVVWTALSGDFFYYCTIAQGRDTLAEAKASTAVADNLTPEANGCGNFAWTRLDPVIELEGTWSTNFGDTEVIDSERWHANGQWTDYKATIVRYENTNNTAYTQTSADDAYTPSKFNKVVWTEVTAGSFYYCTVDYGLDSLEDAIATTKTADPAGVESTGCAGGPWTKNTHVALPSNN